MAACNFVIPFTGDASQVLNKSRSAVQGQGGQFNGDTNNGDFNVSVYGSTISGSYTINGQNMNIIIDSKPFLIPCSTIESFMRSQMTG